MSDQKRSKTSESLDETFFENHTFGLIADHLNPQDLCALSGTNKVLYDLSTADAIWKRITVKRFVNFFDGPSNDREEEDDLSKSGEQNLTQDEKNCIIMLDQLKPPKSDRSEQFLPRTALNDRLWKAVYAKAIKITKKRHVCVFESPAALSIRCEENFHTANTEKLKKALPNAEDWFMIWWGMARLAGIYGGQLEEYIDLGSYDIKSIYWNLCVRRHDTNELSFSCPKEGDHMMLRTEITSEKPFNKVQLMDIASMLFGQYADGIGSSLGQNECNDHQYVSVWWYDGDRDWYIELAGASDMGSEELESMNKDIQMYLKTKYPSHKDRKDAYSQLRTEKLLAEL